MALDDKKVKDILSKSDKVSDKQLTELVNQAEQEKKSLFEVAAKSKAISEKSLLKAYAQSIKVKFIKLGERKVDPKVLQKVPERIARKYRVILFDAAKDKYKLAMEDPEDIQAIDFLEKLLGHNLQIYLAASTDIGRLLEQYKGSLGAEIGKVIPEGEEAVEGEEEEVSAKDVAEDSPTAKTVNLVIDYAIKLGASDIHIEPREDVIQVRYRVDGVLREANTLPRNMLPALVSRIKIMASLKIDEHRKPQDGRFKIEQDAGLVAVRVSVLPLVDGEKVVMRLLDESARAPSLTELGFNPSGLDRMQRAMTQPYGMILVTGPTGSGKSTSLYSVLTQLNTPGVNISTIEDPVEYHIEGVNQSQVNPKAGLTFATGLRALLRQDPNIIMVGEIRDGETASLAIQAALTGHLVLSTLHTNNAVTTLPRLLDMGAEPFLIASTVRVVVGQRLVRKLCPKCRVAYEPSAEEMEQLKHEFKLDETIQHLQDNIDLKAMADDTPAHDSVRKRVTRVIKPPHEGDLKSNSLLNKLAEDPEMLNRSQAEAQTKQSDKPGKKSSSPKVTSQAAPQDRKDTLDPATDNDLGKLKADNFVLFKPGKGCDACNDSAYRGRIGIFEVVEVNERLGKLIVGQATSDELEAVAVEEGMITMSQDGFLKAVQGITTIEEVLRVTRE